ncbi:MAG: hypothetical protein LC644_02500, partial [Pseudonocardia sp.]|nr:hypothetical protein [Pseudonocardia sp.]
ADSAVASLAAYPSDRHPCHAAVLHRRLVTPTMDLPPPVRWLASCEVRDAHGRPGAPTYGDDRP